MSYKTSTQAVASLENSYSKNLADDFSENGDQAGAEGAEMRFPPLPDLIDVEDADDAFEGDRMYVSQLLAERDSIQLGD